MSSRALVIQPVELKPHPLPYGRLSVGSGVWDQMQAQKAYEEVERPERAPALDKKV
jgi:hypothetical protein